ncbi:stage III sporulation protein AA [Priestia taiwanensis]|uniref:Stage III sporulation protein AA n=1 Tax=Priestia taiwanensis TaxID=1347902 RepID=A0A917AHA9_9BACI|nr:stage III sporulation protein AA [Priestia taiwanensis]MBM7361389.1 stage III sporulation protein AA [Priestia taiwanensis]GGE53775.1 stage III sporulation protein AA [Priestia taiwanensis]
MIEVFDVLPSSIQTIVHTMMKKHNCSVDEIEEIRVRVNRPLELMMRGAPYFSTYVVHKEDGVHLLNQLSHYSLYTMEEELRRGYITIKGGHRVGLAGRVVTEKGNVKMIKEVTSFNIRIAKEQVGIAERLIPHIYRGRWQNMMIIGPPQTGKTTLLRDLARIVSIGDRDRKIPSYKVGIVDERSEIAGSVKGIPQYSFGTRVDVLDACPKAEGMMMLIRSMSPEVIVVDEIGREEDTEAIIEAVNAGVQLMVTVHGYEYHDLMKRPSMKEIIEANVFQRFIILSRDQGPGTIKRICDSEGKELPLRVGGGVWLS